MAPDLAAALQDAALAEVSGTWTAESITEGREVLLEGDALRQAIREVVGRDRG